MAKLKGSWKEMKRDIPDHMIKLYRNDRHIYKDKDINQDVDWRFCISHSSEGSIRRKRGKLYLLRHVNPRAQLPGLITTRDTQECYVSKEYRDHKKDWDFVVKYRDKVFKSREYTGEFNEKTTLFDKVAAIADDLSGNCKTCEGKYLHPVDTLINGSWCTGVSAAMVAVAHTMGLEARSIIFSGHTTAEIKIDGKWCFCENIYSKNKTKFTHLVNKSWMEIIACPFACRELPPAQQKYYWKLRDSMYVYSIGTRWHMHTIGTYIWIRLTPYTAKALYPELDKFYLRTPKYGKKNFLLWTGINWDKGLSWDTLRFQKVKQGQGIRKSFYLSGLKGIKSIKSYLILVKDNNINTRSAVWYFRINGGRKHYLKDKRCSWRYSGDVLSHGREYPDAVLKMNPERIRRFVNVVGKESYKELVRNANIGWRWHGGKKKENQLCFELPLKELKADSLNTIELMSDGPGQEYFNVRLFDNPLLSAPKPFFKEGNNRDVGQIRR